MKVRFARWLAVSVTTAGLVLIATAVALLLHHDTAAGIPVVAAGAVVTLVGGLYFGPLPYVAVTKSSVVVPIIAGSQGRVPIGPGDRLRMEGDRIVLARHGGKRRIPALRALAHRGDWDRLAAALRERRLS